MKSRSKTLSFELLVDGAPYIVHATPYTIATKETRFRVSFNDGPVYIFAWDNGLNRMAILDDGPAFIPGSAEMAIANKLQSSMAHQQAA